MTTEERIKNALNEKNYREAFIYMQILLNERTIENNNKLIENIPLIGQLDERLVKVYEFLKDHENRIYELEMRDYNDN